MTHEQKSESAEFRTLGTITMTTAEYDWLVKGAEARGAAEAKKRAYDALNTYPIGTRIGVTRAIMVTSDAIDGKVIRFGDAAEQRRKDTEGGGGRPSA